VKLVKRLLLLFSLALFSVWAIAQSCTGNTTNSFWHDDVLWCCTPVGDNSDWSCTDGESWSLFSELWSEWNETGTEY